MAEKSNMAEESNMSKERQLFKMELNGKLEEVLLATQICEQSGCQYMLVSMGSKAVVMGAAESIDHVKTQLKHSKLKALIDPIAEKEFSDAQKEEASVLTRLKGEYDLVSDKIGCRLDMLTVGAMSFVRLNKSERMNFFKDMGIELTHQDWDTVMRQVKKQQFKSIQPSTKGAQMLLSSGRSASTRDATDAICNRLGMSANGELTFGDFKTILESNVASEREETHLIYHELLKSKECFRDFMTQAESDEAWKKMERKVESYKKEFGEKFGKFGQSEKESTVMKQEKQEKVNAMNSGFGKRNSFEIGSSKHEEHEEHDEDGKDGKDGTKEAASHGPHGMFLQVPLGGAKDKRHLIEQERLNKINEIVREYDKENAYMIHSKVTRQVHDDEKKEKILAMSEVETRCKRDKVTYEDIYYFIKFAKLVLHDGTGWDESADSIRGLPKGKVKYSGIIYYLFLQLTKNEGSTIHITRLFKNYLNIEEAISSFDALKKTVASGVNNIQTADGEQLLDEIIKIGKTKSKFDKFFGHGAPIAKACETIELCYKFIDYHGRNTWIWKAQDAILMLLRQAISKDNEPTFFGYLKKCQQFIPCMVEALISSSVRGPSNTRAHGKDILKQVLVIMLDRSNESDKQVAGDIVDILTGIAANEKYKSTRQSFTVDVGTQNQILKVLSELIQEQYYNDQNLVGMRTIEETAEKCMQQSGQIRAAATALKKTVENIQHQPVQH